MRPSNDSQIEVRYHFTAKPRWFDYVDSDKQVPEVGKVVTNPKKKSEKFVVVGKKKTTDPEFGEDYWRVSIEPQKRGK